MYQVVIYINEQPLSSEPFETIEQAIAFETEVRTALNKSAYSVEVVS